MLAKSLSLSLMLSELQVMFTRRRTWAMLAAIALIPILLALAVYLSADRLAPGEGPPFVDRVTQNGLFAGFAAMLLAMPLFLPLTVSVVAGALTRPSGCRRTTCLPSNPRACATVARRWR